MPIVIVTIRRNGKPARGHQVALEFAGLGTMSKTAVTGQDGVATFSVHSGQEGDVFVDGSRHHHWGAYSDSDVTINL